MRQESGDRGKSGRALFVLAGLVFVLGLAFAAWFLIGSLNPSPETGSPVTRVDLATIPPGGRTTVMWKRDIPVFILHRTPEQIAAARAGDSAPMKFPEADRDRVQRAEWLVVVPRCWRGFLPKGQAPGEPRGRWGGWYCRQHGDLYDLSGRLRTAWGEANFTIPPYSFDGDRWLDIGEEPGAPPP